MSLSVDLREIRHEFNKGDGVGQDRIDAVCDKFKKYKEDLRPGESDEFFELVDSKGQLLGTIAPRWLCHVLGLRHMGCHIALCWDSPALGRVLILQVRSWAKLNSPGKIDISVGGHVKEGSSIEATAYKEMKEELGISAEDLKGGKLTFIKSYDEYNTNEEKNLYNSEFCSVFTGTIKTDKLDKINFNDAEVVGISLFPEKEIAGLLKQTLIPLANGLTSSMPYYLDYIGGNS